MSKSLNSTLLSSSSCRSQLEVGMREVLTVIPFTPITINPNSTSLPLLPSQYILTDYISVSTLNLGISGGVRSMGKETKDGKRRWRKAEGETPPEGAVSSLSGLSGSGNPTDRSTRGLPVLPTPQSPPKPMSIESVTPSDRLIPVVPFSACLRESRELC